MSLCRHYVRELRRSMLIDTPDMDKATSKRSSQLLDNFNLEDASSHPSSHEKGSQDQKISAILRSEDNSKPVSRGRDTNQNDYSPSHSLTSTRSARPQRPSGDRLGETAPSTPGATLDRPPRPSFMTSSHLEWCLCVGGHPLLWNQVSFNSADPDPRCSSARMMYLFA